MNKNYENIKKYIELLELPQEEQLNLEIIKNQYRLLYKKYHPEFTESKEFIDEKKLKEITEAYLYLKDNIDYVNNLLITDIEALEEKKQKIENQRLLDFQIKKEQEQKNKEHLLTKQQEIDIKRQEELKELKQKEKEQLLQTKEEIKLQISAIKEIIKKEQYINKNYKIIRKLLKDFEQEIDIHKNKENLEESFKNVKKEINSINKLSEEEIKKRKNKISNIIKITIISLVILVTTLPILNTIVVNKSEKHLINGEYEKAISLLNKTIGKKSKLLEDRIDIYKALNNNDYDEAIYLFNNYGETLINYYTNGGVLDEEDTLELEHGIYYKSYQAGYEFINYEITYYKMEENNLTINLSAIYERNNYQINYILNGGENNINNPTSFTVENDDIIIAPPERYGHTFLGWRINNSEEIKLEYIIQTKILLTDITLEAIWETIQCKITFDVNGGSLTSSSVILVGFNQEILLPTPKKKGYTFEGWESNSELLKGVVKWDIMRDTTLKARWTLNTYILTYKYFDGQTTVEQTQAIEYGADYTLLAPTRTGYTFMGWYKDTERFSSGRWWYASDIVINAEWEAKTYNISYDLNGGIMLDEAVNEVVFDSEIILPSAIKTDCVFDGWYYNDQKVENGKWTIDKDVVLKAKWLEGDNLILYNLEGGTNNSLNPKRYNPGKEEKILPPTKKGHTFIGWISNEGDTPEKNYIIPNNQKGNIVLKAVWEKTQYKITYQISETESETQIVYYGDHYEMKQITKPGYTLHSWMGPNYETIVSGIWLKETDITVTPVWQAKEFYIYLELNGGMIVGGNIKIIKYDSNYNINIPAKDGYEFLGWYYNGEKIPSSGIWNVDAESLYITINARWKEK